MGNSVTFDEDGLDLNSFLLGIENECEKSRDACLKALGQVAMDNVKRNMTKSERKDKEGQESGSERPHMKDDVKMQIRFDKMDLIKSAVVKGGKRTGTLWHIVNDGTYRSRGTHFMDRALAETDNVAEGIIDATLAFLEG